MAKKGYFGEFGGRYVAEILVGPLEELADSFEESLNDPEFWRVFDYHSKHFTGRPTPLLFAERSTKALGGAQIYVKLEGLANTGAHKINNALGQALLAKKMGKKRIVAETGAGQHGVATAAICARLGLQCCIYMGQTDWERQFPNVLYMELFGAKVKSVTSGSRTLKDAVNEALRDWTESHKDSHYIIGSALGPHPYPDMVREFQCIIGRELVGQLSEIKKEPSALIASVGGGSNAIGFFSEYLDKKTPRLIGVEAGGDGKKHASRMNKKGNAGIVHGYLSLFLSDEDGQIKETHSLAPGLDYPGIGPQLAYLGEQGRIDFHTATDNEALEALRFFAHHEGLIFALESAHAAAHTIKIAPKLSHKEVIVLHMSGRGDKDLFITAPHIAGEQWFSFLSHYLDKQQ